MWVLSLDARGKKFFDVKDRSQYFWIGIFPVYVRREILAVIHWKLEKEHEWEDVPPLPPLATIVAWIHGVNTKAQKINDMYMENGEMQRELATEVVKYYEEARRRAKNHKPITWEKLIELTETP